MGQRIVFERPDGDTCPAYRADPFADPRGAVVVLQEWWGLVPHIEKVVERYADAGFTALAPDLYRGRSAADVDEATHLSKGLDWTDATVNDVRGAILHLARGGTPVAVVGFCMGGALALVVATHVPECDAAVCFYGLPPVGSADVTQIAVPLQCHFATEDDWCTAARVDDLEQQLAVGEVPYELHRYDGASHGFMNETRDAHSPTAAGKAWVRTLQFLGRHIT